MQQWIKKELEHTDLGDKRRTKRLMQIVSNLSQKPSHSIPVASGSWSQTKATYDFWDSPYLKPSMIRQGHIDATLNRIKEYSVVLAIQDTTELNYTSHKSLSGVGYLDSKYANGFKVHSTFVTNTEGLPLGIIGQCLWARKSEQLGKSIHRRQKSTGEKESNKWLNNLRETESTIGEETKIITIADREADIYDLFAYCRSQNSQLLIRAAQNRCLMAEQEHLWQVMESSSVMGKMKVELKGNSTQTSRIATVTIRSQKVTIQPPQNRSKKEQLKPIELQGILVKEEKPPVDVKPLEWLLLTTLDVENLSDGIKYIRWYSYRWLIERYHYVLKSGCRIEKLQLKTAKRIEMALATYSIVAWRLLWLTYLARCRENYSCEPVFETYEWQALYATVYKKIYPHARPPTVKEIIHWISKLGGFLARKNDGEPGVKVLWRGLSRLEDIAQSWLLSQSLHQY